MPQFWQNFPRVLAANRDHVTVGFFPAQAPDVHELQGGEQKTHECFVLFGDDRVTKLPLEWCRSRSVAGASPEWYAASGAVPYIVPA